MIQPASLDMIYKSTSLTEDESDSLAQRLNLSANRYSSSSSSSEEENTKEDAVENIIPYSLPQVIAMAFGAVLEEAIDQLNILGHVGEMPIAEATLGYQTLQAKFGGGLCISYIFDPETIEPFEVALKKQRSIKFQTDRSYVEKVLKETLDELVTTKSFAKFLQRLQEIENGFIEEKNLLEEAKANIQKLEQIKSLLQTEKIDYHLKMQEYCETIGKLRDEYEDLKFSNNIQEQYVEKWENSRFESNSLTLDQKEEYHMDIIKKYKLEIEREIRIDAEIETFILETQTEYEDAIQMWMETYDKEIEQRDLDIQLLKQRREEQFNNLEDLAKLYEEHKREIEKYAIMKERKRMADELRALRLKSAIKIQAWWRGTMVRNCLGPYAKKKKGKKGKGKDKKKK